MRLKKSILRGHSALLLTTILLWTSAPLTAEAETACELLLAKHRSAIAPNFTQLNMVVQALEKIDKPLLHGDRMPTWQDLDMLQSAVNAAKFAKGFRGPEYDEVMRELKAALPVVNENYVLTMEEAARGLQYKPTELELKSLYKALWDELVATMPSALDLPVMRLAASLRNDAELVNQGRKIEGDLKAKFEELFNTTSGFSSYDDYRRALDMVAATDPELAKVRNLLRVDDTEIAIQRPSNARWWFSRVGLHNQHVTGTSRGYRGKAGRNNAEAALTGMSAKDYWALDDAVKPVYGHARPYPTADGLKPDNASHYGDDAYILDKDAIRDRLSFSFQGDSLNRLGAYFNRWGSEAPTDFVPNKWDQVLISWNYRELIASSPVNGTLQWGQNKVSGLNLKGSSLGAQYVEVQVMGGQLDYRVVRAFEFTKIEPTGEDLKAFRDFGIEVRDGTAGRWPPAVWEKDLTITPRKTVGGQPPTGRPVEIKSATLNEVVSTTGSKTFEWAVDVRVKQDLGDQTPRLNVVDVRNTGRRKNPTVQKVGVEAETGYFIYRVRFPTVEATSGGSFYASFRTDSGDLTYSNQGSPKSYFEFNP